MKAPPPNRYRDRWCGELRSADAGAEVRVAGWVHRRRDHGGLVFVDLRDRSGLVQLVFNPDRAPEAHAAAHELRAEHVISARGEIARREEANVNPQLGTGEIEILAAELEHLASAETPPFPVDEETPVDELLRMRYRYVDLRRERPRDTLLLRDSVAQTMRRVLAELDFVEIETPMLTRSTPEGARDFLVPARVQRGSFYALPQSPQLFKQLLMIAGFERYFQIVRCFRDEDPRADRMPEFTQLDVELSFVAEDDVIAATETVMAAVFEAAEFAVAPPPWPRLSYDEAIGRYGLDRPDTRFGLELRDVSEAVRGSQFRVFEGVLSSGGVVLGMNAGPRELSRAELDGLNAVVARYGAQAVAPIYTGADGWEGNLAKFFSGEHIAAVNGELGAGERDLLLFVADRGSIAARALGELRLQFAERFELIPDGRHDVLWVLDFPMFGWSEAEQRWDPLHHPFTSPAPAHGEDELSFDDPGRLRSRAYDLVLDGFEIGGGSIRIHDPELQRRVLELIGIGPEEANARFGFLLDALRYGAPPHGGIALGFDRIVAIVAGWRSVREVNIREAITFPKTATGADPLTGAPAPVDERQLAELGLTVRRAP
jgi:aspartyl-tRNA synthetase